MTDRKTIWNSAGIAGLFLGGLSILYVLLTSLSGSLSSDSKMIAFLISALNACLWAAKLVGSIILFKFFLKKFCTSNEGCDNRDTLLLGLGITICSAILYSAFYLAWFQFVNPESIETVFNTMIEQGGLDSNSISALEAMRPKMPGIIFFSNLIYCFLFGTVLSLIFSRSIPSRNPFDQNRIDKQ